MRTISQALAESLIDYASTDAITREVADGQLKGAVAAYNMIARNRFAYLADEVGMGKTYVAMGVMGLMRHLHPHARILVITPRENIQRKWMREVGNFCQNNWRVVDNRVKSLQNGPARRLHRIDGLTEMVRAYAQNADWDLFLRMPSFSVWSKDRDHRNSGRDRIRRLLPWIGARDIPTTERTRFLVRYGAALNAIVPEIDLLVIDEAHNLKHGFGLSGSTRNLLLATMFGRPIDDMDLPDWYAPKVKRLLLLSATPFEHDYADLWRQLDLFGFGDARVTDAEGADRQTVRLLRDQELPDSEKRPLVQRFLLRRVSGLTIGGELYTRNLYRREWRQGGFEDHDEPLGEADPRERLVVALIQKKVAEVLRHERFNNHFQIGMLSSFESFLESSTQRSWVDPEEEIERKESADQAVFDGQQSPDRREQEGIDSYPLARINRTYRRRFDGSLPHPKLDATVRDLSRTFETGEKALVFVRRVATMQELKTRLDRIYDDWLEARMKRFVPALATEIEGFFESYRGERKQRGRRARTEEELEPIDPDDVDTRHAVEEEKSGTDTFFAWFFRGDGPSNVLSGALFRKGRLTTASSAYALLLEEDLVSWLLGRPIDALVALTQALSRDRAELEEELRHRAYARFQTQARKTTGFPRGYVFEAYQGAALDLLTTAGGDHASGARILLEERFPPAQGVASSVPTDFPAPEASIGVQTIPVRIAAHGDLADALLPHREHEDLRDGVREHLLRVELLSTMARLGAAYVDLYLLAIERIGSFRPKAKQEEGDPAEDLAKAFVDLLARQRNEPGLHAYAVLAGAASAFGTLIQANFPEVTSLPLSRAPREFARWLQSQSPVQTPRGAQVARLVRQFRMPGYPLVVVTTNVLQEGEDLHTFCRKVVHYGITWTPSAMEQRTGRVDRIGGLVQRRWDGGDTPPPDEEMIQVHYPHLAETVERIQVERVFCRMNRFMKLAHRNLGSGPEGTRRIDLDREMAGIRCEIAQIRERLESAFEPGEAWLAGEVGADRVCEIDRDALDSHLHSIGEEALSGFEVVAPAIREDGRLRATLRVPSGRVQPFELELRTQAAGDCTVLRCTSPVGALDLAHDETLDELYDLRRQLGSTKLCVEYEVKSKLYEVTVEGSMLFDPMTTQVLEIEYLIREAVRSADAIEAHFFAEDSDPTVWGNRRRSG